MDFEEIQRNFERLEVIFREGADLCSRIRKRLESENSIRAKRPILKFGELERTIRCRSLTLTLTPTAFRLVHQLWHRDGKRLSYDRARRIVWKKTVDNETIKKCVREANKSLSHGKIPYYIRTSETGIQLIYISEFS